MLRSELGLTWDNIVHDISYQNLIMLSKCTPNYSFKKDDNGSTVKRNNSGIPEPPEFGKRGNVGSFDGLISYFKGIKK